MKNKYAPVESQLNLFSNLDSNHIKYIHTNSIIFYASKLDRITTPGIQKLITADATAKIRSGKVQILQPSESFKNAIRNLGFSKQ